MKYLLIVAVFFAFSAHAYTGKELHADCQAAEDAFAKTSQLDPYSSPQAARCIAYVEGFADGYAISDFLAESVGVKLNAFCLPSGRDLSYRLVRAVLAHLERQPPNPEGSTARLVAGALSKTFPCTIPLEPKK